MFKATDPAVYEALASVILGHPVKTTTEHDTTNDPAELKDFLKVYKRY